MEDDAPGGAVFWTGMALGMGLLAFGVWGLLDNAEKTAPGNWLTFVVGSLILHDAIWAPLIGVGSLVVVRVVPRRVRPTLQGTLIVTVAVLLVVTPALTGRGRNPNNPSILPGDYGPDTLKVLAVVWLGGGLLALRALRREPTAVDLPGRPNLPPVPNGW